MNEPRVHSRQLDLSMQWSCLWQVIWRSWLEIQRGGTGEKWAAGRLNNTMICRSSRHYLKTTVKVVNERRRERNILRCSLSLIILFWYWFPNLAPEWTRPLLGIILIPSRVWDESRNGNMQQTGLECRETIDSMPPVALPTDSDSEWDDQI